MLSGEKRVDLAQEIMRVAHLGDNPPETMQLRKDYGFPYEVHIRRTVAYLEGMILLDPSLLDKPEDYYDIVAALWLHDVVEDCKGWDIQRLRDCNQSELTLTLIESVTNVPVEKKGPNRAARHELNKNRLAKAHKYAKMMKLCDIYDNICDLIVGRVRLTNTEGFYIKYLREKLDVLPHIWVECRLACELKDMLETALYSCLEEKHLGCLDVPNKPPEKPFMDEQLHCIPLGEMQPCSILHIFPDKELGEQAMKEYRAGNSLTTEEYLKELRNRPGVQKQTDVGNKEIYGRPMINDHLG